MAGNKSPYGLNAMTVQEATNSLAQRKVIRVLPTLDTSAYVQHDVLFLSTEIPNAVLTNGGCSKLVQLSIVNHEDNACDIDLVFTGKQVHPGTINEDVGTGSLWTKALAKGANILGSIDHDVADIQVDLVNSLMYTGLDTGAVTGPPLPIFLQAESDSTSVYFFGVDRTGGITFEDGDLEFIFHIEY